MSNRATTGMRVEPTLPLNDSVGSHTVESLPNSRTPPGTTTAVAYDRLAHYLARPLLQLGPIAFAGVVLLALHIGWTNRNEGHLTPETGTGYWLGIVGASMMLLLLLYPIRKRVRFLRHLGRVPSWFRLHMVLGILGPTLILFHSNFKLGSLNSNVALVTMLTVVVSGIVGRYLYAKVHKGLYGRKTEVAEILSDTEALKSLLDEDVAGAAQLRAALEVFEARALAPRRGLLSSVAALSSFGFEAARCHARALRYTEQLIEARSAHLRWPRRERRRRLKAARSELALYFAATKKAARFAVYERLLALWHVLHLPLFLLLVVTAIIHVIAVHLY